MHSQSGRLLEGMREGGRTAPGLPNMIIRRGRATDDPFPPVGGRWTRGEDGFDEGASRMALQWMLRASIEDAGCFILCLLAESLDMRCAATADILRKQSDEGRRMTLVERRGKSCSREQISGTLIKPAGRGDATIVIPRAKMLRNKAKHHARARHN